MRPIQLSISGLHSFRERQTIDFSSLCEGGVFGIFGPTGSGKSSILDALTLALYGKVERATNNTQGILNHAENDLFVSYEFELRNANGKKRYRVERNFKRNDEIRLKSTTCRFLDVTNETVVLADKITEVNDHVQALLGLTVEDFSRAVVLPQGKFAEFLSLKGIDRRKMLQRLFTLEKYGDELNDKVKRNALEERNKLNEILAEREGLGNASADDLKDARKKVEEINHAINIVVKELETAEETYEQMKSIWQWQKEKESIEAELSQLQNNEVEIQKMESEIARAKEATHLLPFLKDLEDAKAEKEKTETQFEEMTASLVEVTGKFKQIESIYMQRKQQKIEKEPIFIIKLEKLNQAQKITTTMKEKETEKIRVSSVMEKEKHNLAELQKEVERLIKLREKAIARQQELNNKLKEITVPYEKRQEILRAYEEKKEIVTMERAIAERMKEKEQYDLQIEEKKKGLAAYEDELIRKKEALLQRFEWIEKKYTEVMELQRQVENAVSLVEMYINKEKKLLEQNRTEQLAEKLRAELTEGKPCPVCGSLEHKQNANHPPIVGTESELLELEEAQKTLFEKNSALAQYNMQLEQLSTLVTEMITEEIQAKTSMGNESREHQVFDVEKAKQSKVGCLQSISAISTEVNALRQDLLHISEKLKGERSAFLQLQKEYEEQANSYSLLNESLLQLVEKVEKQDQLFRQMIVEFNNKYPSFTLETIEEEKKELFQKEDEVEKIRKGLEKSIPFLEEKEKEISSANEEIYKVEMKIARLETSVLSLDQEISTASKSIAEITKEVDIDKEIEVTKSLLNRLIEEEASALKEYEQIQSEKNNCEKKYTATEQSLHEKQNYYYRAEHKWQELLDASIFEEEREAVAAFIPKDTLEIKKNKVESYWDALKKFTAEVTRLAQLLQNKEISKEHWHAIQQEVVNKKQQMSVLQEEKGAAMESYREIERKHKRFKELEEMMEEVAKKAEQLGKLQQVLRGNAFIEFIAEEQLHQVSKTASERLYQLTRGRYALEIDSNGGFVIRDDVNGGVKRPVSTLSGGETFLTSLALALSLSTQIQLRGEYPLEFFFLDEGFGTLDQELLDIVITALEKLQSSQLAVGVISHVQELRARLPRKLIVHPADPAGKGSTVEMELH